MNVSCFARLVLLIHSLVTFTNIIIVVVAINAGNPASQQPLSVASCLPHCELVMYNIINCIICKSCFCNNNTTLCRWQCIYSMILHCSLKQKKWGGGSDSVFIFVMILPYFPVHKMHHDFFIRNFRKKNNDECILILVNYWKKTVNIYTKIGNHNII
jgi:hypothetical protein